MTPKPTGPKPIDPIEPTEGIQPGLMPAIGDPFMPVAAPVDLSSIEPTLREASLDIGQRGVAVIDPPLRILREADTAYQQFTNPILGTIERQLESADQELERLDRKAVQQIVNALVEAETYGEAFSIPAMPSTNPESTYLGPWNQPIDPDYPGQPGWTVKPEDPRIRPIADIRPDGDVVTIRDGPDEVLPDGGQEYTGSECNTALVSFNWQWQGERWEAGVIPDGGIPNADGTALGDPSGWCPVGRLGDNGLWNIDGNLYFSWKPCLPVPPSEDVVGQMLINGEMYWLSPYTPDRYAKIAAMCKTQPAVCQPPPPVSCPAPKPSCAPGCIPESEKPCDLDKVFSGWLGARERTNSMTRAQAKQFLCAVRMLACIKCMEDDESPIAYNDYGTIAETIKAGGNGLQWIPNWVARVRAAQASGKCGPAMSYPLDAWISVEDENGNHVEWEKASAPTGAECNAGFQDENIGPKLPPPPGPCEDVNLMELPDWGSLDVCKKLDEKTQCILAPGDRLSAKLQFSQVDEDTLEAPRWWKKIFGAMPERIQMYAWHLTVGAIDGLQYLAQQLPESAHCNAPAMVVPVVTKALMGIINKIVGGGLDDLIQGQTYAINNACPTLIPSVEQANMLHQRGVIDKDLHECWVKANNYHIEPQCKVVEAEMAVPSPYELIRLKEAGAIKDEEYKKLMNLNTIKDDERRKHFERLFCYIPPYTDLTQFMVRDVEVEQVVEEQGYDEGFEARFKGKVEEWAKEQGISKEVMKYIWRAHWRTVGLHQMAEALFRLRPNKEGVTNVTTEEDVKKQLEIDDVPKFWRERLVEALYRPLTRVDVRRAYEIGVIDKEGVESSYLDEGYTPTNAKVLADFAEQLKRLTLRRRGGAKPSSYYVTQFTDNVIDEDELYEGIRNEITDEDIVREIVNDAYAQRTHKARKAAIKAVTRRYVLGDYDYASAVAELIRCGVPSELARENLDYCRLQDKLRSKEVAGATLCKWRGSGLISQSQHIERLIRIGYGQPDAVNIALQCTADINRRIAAEMKALRKEYEAELRRQEAEFRKRNCLPKKKCPPGQE